MFATLVGAYPSGPRPRGRSLDDIVRGCIEEQIDAGLGLLTDGQSRRENAVSAVASGLDGIDISGGQPRAYTLPAWTHPILVADWRFADQVAREAVAERGLEPLPVKACLVGPYTLARSADPGQLSREALTIALAEALGQEVRALVEAGTPVVQLDENALTMIGKDDDAERALARGALDRVTAAVADLPAAHLCLAVAGGNAEFAGQALFYERAFSSYLFDLIAGPDNWRLIADAPRDRGIICGVADTRSTAHDDEPVMVWAARYAAQLGGRGLDRVGLAPSAGLEHLPRDRAKAIIEALAEAARKAGLPGRRLASELDPRAVDARSAALGRVEPAP
ncbi:MAG: hypothetical protein ABIZ34_02145 [Candidatus Limnocylindrales bacterium]